MFGWTVDMPWWLLVIIGMFIVPMAILWYTFYFIFVWPLRAVIRANQRSRDGYQYGAGRWTTEGRRPRR